MLVALCAGLALTAGCAHENAAAPVKPRPLLIGGQPKPNAQAAIPGKDDSGRPKIEVEFAPPKGDGARHSVTIKWAGKNGTKMTCSAKSADFNEVTQVGGLVDFSAQLYENGKLTAAIRAPVATADTAKRVIVASGGVVMRSLERRHGCAGPVDQVECRVGQGHRQRRSLDQVHERQHGGHEIRGGHGSQNDKGGVNMMRLILLAAAVLTMVTPGLAATYKSPDGTLFLSARTIDVNGKTDTFVATGKAHVLVKDPTAGTSLEADAEKMTVVVNWAKNAKSGKAATGGASLKSANMAGPVTMVYTFPDSSGGISKFTATADNADFDGATSMAHLTGHVKIVNENPAIFAEPAVMVGDKATVNLSPNPGPEGFRFRVESSPGVSTITVTPKPKESQ